MKELLNSPFAFALLILAVFILASFVPPRVTHSNPTSADTGWTTELRDRIKREEGVRLEAYRDGDTFRIGYGHGPVKEGTVITARRADSYLDRDLRVAIMDARHFLGSLEGFPDSVKVAVADLAFQLGWSRLDGFTKLRSALMRRDWNVAGEEVLDSEYAKQNPERAKSIAELIERN